MRYPRTLSLALLLCLALGSACSAPSTTAAQPLPIGGCPSLPADNVWNTPIDDLPAHPSSAAYVDSIGSARTLHPDFGAGLWDGGPIGIPYVVVPQDQPLVPISFLYDDESDPGPYPIPPNPPIEGGPNSSPDSDRHILIVQQNSCTLYEIYNANPNSDGSWSAGSGAVFNLRSNALRPAGWTSADAAGLPLLPGLVRYDEVAAGSINHALRFTAPARSIRDAYIWPARHEANSETSLALPPMGQRFRLKASFDSSGFSAETRVILQALKQYGMILADNGSSWYISGVPDERWNNDVLVSELHSIPGSAFEAVDQSVLMLDPDSGQAAQDRKRVTPTTAQQGQEVSYTIDLVAGVSAIQLTDQLPAGLTVVEGSLSTTPETVTPASYQAGTISWSRGASASAERVTIRYRATVSTAQRAALTNSAVLTRESRQQTLSATLIINGLRVFLPSLQR